VKPGSAERRLRRRTVYRGRVVDLFVDEIRARGGGRFIREVVGHRPAVAVVPLLPGPKVVLVRQFRYAIGRWSWEIPAGLLNRGERPATAARRELREETGYAARHLEPLVRVFSSPGFSREMIHLYIAKELKYAGPPKPDADEWLEAVILPFDRARRLAEKGEIQDAKSVLGLCLTARNLGL